MFNPDNAEEILKLCWKKYKHEVKMSWSEIDLHFHLKPDSARQLFKRYRKANGVLEGKYRDGHERIIIFSDLHIPSHQEELILEIVRKNKTVNKIIINGDLLDCQAVSSWFDEDMTILDREMDLAHKLLCKIREITKADIILVKGNHEQRVNRHYAQYAKAMGTSVVETEILYKLAHGFTLRRRNSKERIEYEPIENVTYCDARSFQYGDLLVNHPSSFSKNYMQTVTKIYEGKLKDRYPEAKVVVVGHSHQLGMIYIENGIVLIESGCTCYPARYADNDDRPYRVQQYGYVYLEMQDGVVIQDSIKINHLGNDNEIARAAGEDMIETEINDE
jgi:predicted phosphodiesterase